MTIKTIDELSLTQNIVACENKDDFINAVKQEINLSCYAQTADLDAYAKKTDLDAYAKKTDLDAYITPDQISCDPISSYIQSLVVAEIAKKLAETKED